jgi:hypothetical protein
MLRRSEAGIRPEPNRQRPGSSGTRVAWVPIRVGNRVVVRDRRQRRRGPQVRQERGRVDASIARSAQLGAAAPLPRGGPSNQRHPNKHQGVVLKAPSELRIAREQAWSAAQAADLRFCAPGRTRTCNLRIRSETRPVRLVVPWSIAAAGSGSSSNQCHRGRLRDNDRIANRIATQGNSWPVRSRWQRQAPTLRSGGRSGYDGLVGSSAGTSASGCRAAGASAGW